MSSMYTFVNFEEKNVNSNFRKLNIEYTRQQHVFEPTRALSKVISYILFEKMLFLGVK